jgi:hypothetical protein
MKRLISTLCMVGLWGCSATPAQVGSTGTTVSVGTKTNGSTGSTTAHTLGGSTATATSNSTGTGSTGEGSTASSTGATTTASSTGTTAACRSQDEFVGIGNDALCCSGSATADGYCQAASAATTTGSGSTTAGTATTGSTGACRPDDQFVGLGNEALCCSGRTDAAGYCTSQAVTTGTTGTGTTGTTGTNGTVATGTTTGGTCPANMPDLATGTSPTGTRPCNGGPESAGCPSGYSCVGGFCQLHGGSSPLQVTLSFDDNEDVDLHLREPKPSGGTCEIYYGNPGPVPAFDAGFNFPVPIPTPSSCSVGWLDRDSNSGCNTPLDGINVENIIYPSNTAAPSGTYEVYVDYWQDCDSKPSSNYGVQVRVNGAIYKYCGVINSSQADNGNSGAGFLVTRFTVP